MSITDIDLLIYFAVRANKLPELVGDEASGWNPFLNSLLQLAEELEELGIAYVEGASGL